MGWRRRRGGGEELQEEETGGVMQPGWAPRTDSTASGQGRMGVGRKSARGARRSRWRGRSRRMRRGRRWTLDGRAAAEWGRAMTCLKGKASLQPWRRSARRERVGAVGEEMKMGKATEPPERCRDEVSESISYAKARAGSARSGRSRTTAS